MIIAQPANTNVPPGGSATFGIAAMGSAPLGYFWQRNGTTILGATNSSYTTNNVQLTDSGSQFSCLVSNAYGSILSSNATLTVSVPNNPVFLNGNYLYLPINTNGVFIAASTGGKFNSAGTGGAFGIDFWWPGTPVYNYVIGVGGIDYANGNFRSVTVSNLSSGSLQRALIDAMVIPGPALYPGYFLCHQQQGHPDRGHPPEYWFFHPVQPRYAGQYRPRSGLHRRPFHLQHPQ